MPCESEKRRAEVEEIARQLFELTVGENIDVVDTTYREQERAFIEKVAPRLLQWEKAVVDPYIKRTLELNWALTTLRLATGRVHPKERAQREEEEQPS